MIAKDFNILKDRLQPQSFGEQIDALIITNIRMWHAQEVLFEEDTLAHLDKEGMFNTLKVATALNLERNVYMDGSDASFARTLEQRHPHIAAQLRTATHNADQTIIWEQL